MTSDKPSSPDSTCSPCPPSKPPADMSTPFLSEDLRRRILQRAEIYVKSAIAMGSLETLKDVYKFARVTTLDKDGNTALHYAARKGDHVLLRWVGSAVVTLSYIMVTSWYKIWNGDVMIWNGDIMIWKICPHYHPLMRGINTDGFSSLLTKGQSCETCTISSMRSKLINAPLNMCSLVSIISFRCSSVSCLWTEEYGLRCKFTYSIRNQCSYV